MMKIDDTVGIITAVVVLMRCSCAITTNSGIIKAAKGMLSMARRPAKIRSLIFERKISKP